jgi:hypothetical protein
VCVVDAQGRIVKEAKVASDPDALVAWFKEVGLPMVRIGLEAGPLSALAAELVADRVAVVNLHCLGPGPVQFEPFERRDGGSYVLRLFLTGSACKLFSYVLLRSNEANAWPNAESN